MPLLVRAASESADVVIVGVASLDTAEAAQQFMGEFDMDDGNVFDSGDEIHKPARRAAFPYDLRLRRRR